MGYLINYLKSLRSFYFELAPSLLFGIAVAGILNILLKKELILKTISKNPFLNIFYTSFVGVPLPLCSCSVLPTAKLLSKKGFPKASVAAFLTSTPMTGVDSIILTFTSMGLFMSVFRPISALIMGIIVGFNVLIFGSKYEQATKKTEQTQKSIKKQSLLFDFYNYAFVEFLDGISSKLIFGILLGSAITVFLPSELFESFIFKSGIIAYVAMILLGLPMYVCATASIPIALAFLAKGVYPGAVFVFLTAGPVSNLAAWAIVKDTLGVKNFVIYLVSIMSLSVISAYILDYLVQNFGFKIILSDIEHKHIGILSYASFVILGVFLLASLYRIYLKRFFVKAAQKEKRQIVVEGMVCNKCEESVKNVFESFDNIKDVVVSAKNQSVYYNVNGKIDIGKLKEKIDDIGYKLKEEV